MIERRTFLTGVAAVGAATLLGCSSDDDPPTPPKTSSPPTTAPTTEGPVNPKIASTIASGLNVPWGIVFLANGDALVSQRDEGSIVRVTQAGDVTTVGEVSGVRGGGEGGLLGLALAPGDESTIFAYFTTSSEDKVVRMSLAGGKLGSATTILDGIEIGSRHHGGDLLFGKDGTLYVSTGDSGDGPLAQDKDALNGKILRLTADGKAADGNPFNNRTWSYGHRNIEGLAFDGADRLWAVEFGQNTSDELNLIERGANYGWPEAEGDQGGDEFVRPKVTWRTSECSPAGLAITRSTAFLGALQGECLFGVSLNGTETGEPKAYFSGENGRVRSVAAAPDGALWVTTSNTDGRGSPGKDDDRILRVTL